MRKYSILWVGFLFHVLMGTGAAYPASETLFNAASAVSGDLHVIMVFDPQREADTMQLRGISEALKKHTKVADVQEISIHRKELWLKSIAFTEGTVVILTAQQEGIDLIESLRVSRPKLPKALVFVHVSQHVLEGHPRLSGKADIIALPRHAVTLGQVLHLFPSRVVLTRGVAHALSAPGVIKAFRESTFKLPEHARYLTVILGGDTDLPNGDILFYTPEEASRLARYSAQRAKDIGAHLMVLNRPCTGKFDPGVSGKKNQKQERPDVHRNGVLDPVTQTFMRTLKDVGIQPSDVTLYDFQWGKPDPYVELLGATLTHPGSHMLFPGESASRVSQGADILPVGGMTVFLNGAMHETHKRHVAFEWREGRFDTLSADMELEKTPAQRSKKPIVHASDSVARAIVNVLKTPVLVNADHP